MKIFCLARTLDTGGAEYQLTGLAVMLKQDGHDVSMVTFHDRAFYQEMLSRNGIRHILVPKKLTTLGLDIRLASLIKKEKVDLVIGFGSSASRKGCGAKFLFPHFKLIVSERNANPEINLFDRYRMLVYGFADKVISNSYAQEKFLREHLPHRCSRLETIVNFVDTKTFTPLPFESHDRFTIVTTARVCKRKNIHTYIRAARLAADWGYHPLILWYGIKRDSSYLRECLDLIEELGLKDTFRILPAVKDVKEVYRSCDAFCLPSFYEGTSNSLTEALACGRPAICSRVSDNPLYVQDGVSGLLFDPQDPSSIAEAITNIMELEQKELLAYGLKGCELVSRALDPELFHQRYRKVIEELAI